MEPNENVEWRLSELLDALAVEVDRAQDTLFLKSYARGLSVALKGLSLDLAVSARVDGQGRIFFRSVDPGQSSGTILRLRFEEIAQGQLEEVRRPLEEGSGNWPLSTLPGIAQEDIDALEAVSIFTLDDLRRCAQTPPLVAELSRRTGIPDARLRAWTGSPFLTRIVPVSGAPGETSVLEGENLGTRSASDRILFPGQVAEVLEWNDSRITVRVPEGARSGPVYGIIDGAATNPLAWTLKSDRPVDLTLRRVAPADGQAGMSLTIILEGSGFLSGMAVSFGPGISMRRLTAESATRLVAEVAIAEDAAPGPRDVTVSSPDATLSATLRSGFTVAPRQPTENPTLRSIAPAGAKAGTTLAVTLTGSGFQTGLAVSFGPAIRIEAIERLSANEVRMKVVLPPRARGAVDVEVTNPDGGRAVLEGGFRILPYRS